MSGGSLDYVYQHVEGAAEAISSRSRNLQHRAFARHLRAVARALHDLEWVFSCDYGEGDERAAIEAVISPTAVLEEAISAGEKAIADLVAAVNAAKQRNV